MRLSLRATKSPSAKKHYDWQHLRNDAELQSRFRVELRTDRYSEYDESSNVTEQYEALVQANQQAAKVTLPLVKKSTRERERERFQQRRSSESQEASGKAGTLMQD